jgi:hypothetical protein
MFSWLKKKAKNKELDLKIAIIEQLGTLKIQNDFMWRKIQELQAELAELKELCNGTI